MQLGVKSSLIYYLSYRLVVIVFCVFLTFLDSPELGGDQGIDLKDEFGCFNLGLSQENFIFLLK
jgi:hypothetical protein